MQVEGKVRQLTQLLTDVPFEDISGDFQWKSVLEEDRVDYFNTMMAEALTTFFNVPTEDSDIASLDTIQQIVDRINTGSA